MSTKRRSSRTTTLQSSAIGGRRWARSKRSTANADGGAPLLPQIALTALVRSGTLDRHLRHLRRIYAARLAAMVEALRGSMPAGARWTEPAAGHSVWLTLPRAVDGESVFRDALDEGV